MKKLALILLAMVMALTCTAALAEEDVEVRDPVVLPISCEDIGGDAHWPSFRGLQWSMDKDVVWLIEQSRGAQLTAMRDDEDMSVYIAEELDFLGHKAKVFYYFTGETGLYSVNANIALGSEDEADMAAIAELMQALRDVYGEPESDKWQDGAWQWPAGDGEPVMLAVWGHDGVGETHAAGEKYLIGQVDIEAREDSEGARSLTIIMMGQMQVTPGSTGN